MTRRTQAFLANTLESTLPEQRCARAAPSKASLLRRCNGVILKVSRSESSDQIELLLDSENSAVHDALGNSPDSVQKELDDGSS